MTLAGGGIDFDLRRFLCAEFKQCSQCVAGAVSGARFHPPSGQKEDGDRAGALEIDFRVMCGRGCAWEESHRHAHAEFACTTEEESPPAPQGGRSDAQ